jgi:hypothetical protein
MFKVFHVDVAKVDRDVTHVAMVVHICCRLMFSMFICFFQRVLQVCLFGCCICFQHDASVLSRYCVCLQWFQVFSCVFVSVSDVCFACFQTYVAFVVSGYFKTRLSVATSSSPFCCLASVSDAGRRRWASCACGHATDEMWAGDTGCGI